MRRHSLYIGALAALLLATVGTAEARMHAPYRGHRIVPSAGVADGVAASLLEGYSFRRVKSTYAGPGIKLRRASDSLTQDINYLGFTGFTGAPLDTVQAAAFCGGPCYVHTVFDQSGGNRHLVQAAPADQPLYVASCTPNGNPCMRLDASDWMQSSVSTSATTGVLTVSGVVKRTAGTTSAPSVLSPAGGSNLAFYPAAGFMAVYPGPGLTATAAENAWHSAVAVVNGASSNLNVDGNQFPGTQATTPTSGLPVMGSAAGAAYDWAEAMAWNAYVLSPAEEAAVIANQRSFWGF